MILRSFTNKWYTNLLLIIYAFPSSFASMSKSIRISAFITWLCVGDFLLQVS